MNYFRCKRSVSDMPVSNGLALTPSQIAENSRLGIPSMANPQPIEAFSEGSTSTASTVPIEYRRGVGISDCWNASINAKRKYRSTMSVTSK